MSTILWDPKWKRGASFNTQAAVKTAGWPFLLSPTMRRILLSVLLLALITLVHAGSTPMPRSSIPNLVEARQVKRAELVARQKYPDLFRKRDDVPSTGNNPCPNFAKRDFVALQVLSASEAAAFLKGRGSFTS